MYAEISCRDEADFESSELLDEITILIGFIVKPSDVPRGLLIIIESLFKWR